MNFNYKKGKKHRSLKVSSLTAFIFSFLIPSFLLILFLFLCYIKITVNAQEKEYRNTLKILSSHLVNQINANSGLSLTYLFDPEVSNLFFFLNKKEYTQDMLAYTHYAQEYTSTLNNRMTLLGNSITGIGFIPCNSNSDNLFYLKKYSSLQIIENYEYKSSGWYKQLQDNNQTALFVLSETGTRENSISLIRTVKNIDKRQVVGYEILDISLDFIFESLKDISMTQYSGIFLESPKQELLFSTNELLSPVLQSFLKSEISVNQSMKQYDLYSFTDKSFGLLFTIFHHVMVYIRTCDLLQVWFCYFILV